MTPTDSYFAAAPFSVGGGHRVFDLDTSPDSLTLESGVHEILNGGSVLAFVRLGSAVSIPADKAAETAGQAVIPAGGVLIVAVDDETALHAITASGTTTLHIVRKASV